MRHINLNLKGLSIQKQKKNSQFNITHHFHHLLTKINASHKMISAWDSISDLRWTGFLQNTLGINSENKMCWKQVSFFSLQKGNVDLCF